MSLYGLRLEGWDDRSTWGYDPPLESFYAQLTRNGESDDDGPEIWITPPVYPNLRRPEDLALAIARATGVDLTVVHSAMNQGLGYASDEERRLHSPTASPHAPGPTKTSARLLRLLRGRGGMHRRRPGS
jgi:hypothetical protein